MCESDTSSAKVSLHPLSRERGVASARRRVLYQVLRHITRLLVLKGTRTLTHAAQSVSKSRFDRAVYYVVLR